MERHYAAELTGLKGEALDEFMAGVHDGAWLAMMDMPCWRPEHRVLWTPYDDGRMTGWFDGLRPPMAKHDPMTATAASFA